MAADLAAEDEAPSSRRRRSGAGRSRSRVAEEEGSHRLADEARATATEAKRAVGEALQSGKRRVKRAVAADRDAAERAALKADALEVRAELKEAALALSFQAAAAASDALRKMTDRLAGLQRGADGREGDGRLMEQARARAAAVDRALSSARGDAARAAAADRAAADRAALTANVLELRAKVGEALLALCRQVGSVASDVHDAVDSQFRRWR